MLSCRRPSLRFVADECHQDYATIAVHMVPELAATPARRQVCRLLQFESYVRPVLDMAALFEVAQALAGAIRKERDPV